MIKRTVGCFVSLAVLAFIGFWLFLPFIIGSILCVIGITMYKKYKPQAHIDNNGKAVLITGCDTGFGHTLAYNLDKKGYQVFAGCLFPYKDGAVDLKSKCSSRLHILNLDVTSERQVSRSVDYVKNNLADNKLWAVVNNAGIAPFCPAEWLSVSTYEKVMAVNYTGTVRVTMAFLPLLRQSEGRLINVSSLAGRTALPGFGAYAPSKFAVIGFSDIMRHEMKRFGIRVITIEPALYRTPMSDIETQSRYIAQRWSELSDGLKSDYGQEYFDNFMNKNIKFGEAANPNVKQVIDCMMDAVTAVDPPRRYIPNFTIAMLHYVMHMLPSWITDKLLEMSYK